MSKFFSRLSYSIGNEDFETEARALSVKPTDTVLCITASGDRPLNLLKDPCEKIVAVDANGVQNYLLELKIEAMKNLSYRHYLAFLGAIPCKHRLKTYRSFAHELSVEARQFWDSHLKLIRKGVLYQGAVEKLTKKIAIAFRFLRPFTIRKIFSFDNLAEQKEFVDKQWDRKWWRGLFEVVLNPKISKFAIEDPGLANVGTRINPGRYIYDRMYQKLQTCLARQSLLFSLMFRGKVYSDAFGPYLTQAGIDKIKPRLNKIEIRAAEIVSYLESIEEPTFDCFSLSDIASYMDDHHFRRLLKAIYKTAKPGARFCMRQFLSTQVIPHELNPYFKRDVELEKTLEKKEKCFIYRFMVGKIKKPAEAIFEDPCLGTKSPKPAVMQPV